MTEAASRSNLASRILFVVATSPGVSTNELCKQVKVRKAVTLDELERLQQIGVLRVERGFRASKSWYLLSGQGNQFPTCSRSMPGASFNAASALMERDHRPRLLQIVDRALAALSALGRWSRM
jgi:hypothetical protein